MTPPKEFTKILFELKQVANVSYLVLLKQVLNVERQNKTPRKSGMGLSCLIFFNVPESRLNTYSNSVDRMIFPSKAIAGIRKKHFWLH